MPAAIRIEHIGKTYRLDGSPPHGALRDVLSAALGVPWRLVTGGRRRPAAPEWVQALDDVSFDIGEGEIAGIIGRNGSGKSTLLKILSRITAPSSGRAIVRGRVGALLEVGTGFHHELTGRENVFVNGAILGMRREDIARRFDEIVDFAGVARFIDTPVKHYSSGMQMRLAFSVAAHLEPDILLVDEVLAVGDLAFQKKCLGKMDDVSRQGRTVLFVSHQMNQLRRLCTRIAWLDGGRLAGIGGTADVINRYEASFAGSVTEQLEQGGSSTGFLGWTLGSFEAPQHVVSTFGPLVLRVLLRVHRPIRNGHHGIALYDREGTVVWGAAQDGLTFDAGDYEIVYDLPGLPLRPGAYRWHVSLFSDGRFITNLDCVPEMSVETRPLGHQRDEYAGFLNFPYRVRIAPVSVPRHGEEADRGPGMAVATGRQSHG